MPLRKITQTVKCAMKDRRTSTGMDQFHKTARTGDIHHALRRQYAKGRTMLPLPLALFRRFFAYSKIRPPYNRSLRHADGALLSPESKVVPYIKANRRCQALNLQAAERCLIQPSTPYPALLQAHPHSCRSRSRSVFALQLFFKKLLEGFDRCILIRTICSYGYLIAAFYAKRHNCHQSADVNLFVILFQKNLTLEILCLLCKNLQVLRGSKCVLYNIIK